MWLISILLLGIVHESFQICHNNVCDTDKCTADKMCPDGFTCDHCGYCVAIDGYCHSNSECDLYNGICDIGSNPYTTCEWCNADHVCVPGCSTNSNCEAGYECNNHLCVEKTGCTDDDYCNQGLTNICDIESTPYTQCMYCDNGDCVPGCLDDTNCPGSYTCQNHKCEAAPGKVLIESITIKTESCDGCSTEGVVAVLKGESVTGFPSGVPCSTATLDHAGVVEFGSGGSSRFDGTLNGAQNDDEEAMMAGCFHAALNAQLVDGTLTWKGDGKWMPETVCVDWKSDNFANQCSISRVAGQDNTFALVNCHSLNPQAKCN